SPSAARWHDSSHTIRSAVPWAPLPTPPRKAPSLRALYKPGPHAGLELVERPEPEPGPAEVKIRVMTTGICGTDLHIRDWASWASSMINAPMVVGHEFYGEVVAVGDRVQDVS